MKGIIEKIHGIVMEERRMHVREIDKAVGIQLNGCTISYTKKLSARWVP